MSLDGSFTVYQQEDNLSTSTNSPLTFTCSRNKNQLLFIQNEHLLFLGLQTMVVNSHKRVLLKLPVFTLFYACIYETNSVYVQKCMSIHVGIYMYTHGTCQPLHMRVCDLDDTCNGTYTEVGELLCHDPCPQKNQRDCGFRMHTSADRCP